MTLEIFTTPGTMRARSEAHRACGGSVAFVPTMGYLHEGHASLVRGGRALSTLNVVSIFVNPLQFNDPADLARYPVDTEGDLAKCVEWGADVVYMPTRAALYPEGFETRVVPGSLASGLCGAARPGHFEGVTTVVAKLFLAVAPHVAIFGEKDYQQLAVVRRMVRDLDFPVEVIGMPTVREADGLAMSSRNARLSPEARARAAAIPRALRAAGEAARAGARAAEIASGVREALLAAGADSIDYVEIIHEDCLRPVLGPVDHTARLALAAFFGGIRLIDNAPLVPAPPSSGA